MRYYLSFVLLPLASLCGGGQGADLVLQFDLASQSFLGYNPAGEKKAEVDVDPQPTSEYSEEVQRRRDESRRQWEADFIAANKAAFSIPTHIYDKALADPQSLTPAERHSLLARGDLFGRVLADPVDGVTRAERHDILGWAEPAVAERLIRAATGGALSTPAELYNKAEQEGVETLSREELRLLTTGFHEEDEEEDAGVPKPFFSRLLSWNMLAVRGNVQAHLAVMKAEGVAMIVQDQAFKESKQRRNGQLLARYARSKKNDDADMSNDDATDVVPTTSQRYSAWEMNFLHVVGTHASQRDAAQRRRA